MTDLKRSLRLCAVVMLCLMSGLLVPSILLFARGGKEKKEVGSDRQTFRVPVDVVVVNAAVVDKDGKPVTDLTAKDFRVFEDGKPQEIQTFALEAYGRYDDVASGSPATPASESPAAQSAMRRNAETPRLVSFVIDDLTMESVENFPRMVEAIREYVRNEMKNGDQLTILSGSGRVQVPFSDNKQRLLDELATIPERLNLSPIHRIVTDNEAMNSPGGIDRFHQGYLFRMQMVRMLETLRQHIRVLRRFEGARSLMLFSDGFVNVPDVTWTVKYHLQEVIDLALRSGIILNTVSILGVRTYGQDGLWVDDSWGPGQDVFWKFDDEVNQAVKHETLSRMAYETGGAFSHTRNDLRLGVQEIARRRSYQYVLSYVAPAHRPDGAYHHIRLELVRPELKVSYRKGYYAQKEELQYESGSREDIIEALNAPGDLKEIPMTLSYNYSQVENSTYAVSFVTRADIKGVQFAREDARCRNVVNLVLAAFDENDRFIEGVNKSIEFRMLEESYAGLRNRGLSSRVELKLPPGRYKIKAVVRENNQGKMGSAIKSVEIP